MKDFNFESETQNNFLNFKRKFEKYGIEFKE